MKKISKINFNKIISKKILTLFLVILSAISLSYAKTTIDIKVVSTTTDSVVMNIKVNADTNLVGYINTADQETAAVYLSERVGEFKQGQSETSYTYKKTVFADRETNVIFSLKDNLNRISGIEFVTKIPAVKSLNSTGNSVSTTQKSILIDNCNLNKNTSTTTFEILNGPSVLSSDKLYLNCIVKTDNKNLNFAYNVTKKGETSKVIETGEVKGVKSADGFYIEMPRQKVAQGYDVSIYMIGANKNRLSNDLLVKYTEFGPQANINSLEYSEGNVLIKTNFIGNPFDKKDTTSPRYDAEINYQVVDFSGATCASGSQALVSPTGITETKILVSENCIKDNTFKVIVKVIETANRSELANFSKVITIEPKVIQKTEESNNKNIFILIGLIAIVMFVVVMYKIKGREIGTSI